MSQEEGDTTLYLNMYGRPYEKRTGTFLCYKDNGREEVRLESPPKKFVVRPFDTSPNDTDTIFRSSEEKATTSMTPWNGRPFPRSRSSCLVPLQQNLASPLVLTTRSRLSSTPNSLPTSPVSRTNARPVLVLKAFLKVEPVKKERAMRIRLQGVVTSNLEGFNAEESGYTVTDLRLVTPGRNTLEAGLESVMDAISQARARSINHIHVITADALLVELVNNRTRHFQMEFGDISDPLITSYAKHVLRLIDAWLTVKTLHMELQTEIEPKGVLHWMTVRVKNVFAFVRRLLHRNQQ